MSVEEFKGCKGAWIHHTPHGCQHSVGGWIQSEKGKICDVYGLEVGREAAYANAILISAAPDLLVALQEMVGSLGVMVTDADSCAEIIKARAAINKALGK